MTIPIIYGQFTPHVDLYTRALSSIYHYQTRIYDPDYGLQRDPDYYEKIRGNPDIEAALQKRFHDVAGHHWVAEPYSDEWADVQLAAIVTDGMKQVANMLTARVLLAQACLTARSYAFIRGERRVLRLGNDNAKQSWWVPVWLEEIDKRRVDYIPVRADNKPPEVGINLEARRRLWSVERQRWEDIVQPDSLIEYVYADEENRMGYGRGLGESLYFYSRFCSMALEKGLQALDRYAQGLVVVKMDGSRVGSKDRNNDDIVQRYIDEIKKHRSEHVLVVDGKDEIEVKDMPAASHNAAMDYVKGLTESMVRLILGSTRPTGGGEGGSLARTSEEAEQTESLLQFDRALLDEVMSSSLVKLFLKVNKPTLSALGLSEARAPRFLTRQEKREDVSKNAADIKVLLEAGVPLKADEVYHKIGFTKPTDQDEQIVGTPPPSPFGAPPPGLGGDENPSPFGDKGDKPKTDTPELPSKPKQEPPNVSK